jgi:hypothetical protein
MSDIDEAELRGIVFHPPHDLGALAARTGMTVEHYIEMLEHMTEEDRVDFFVCVVAHESGLTVTEVYTLLSGHRRQ